VGAAAASQGAIDDLVFERLQRLNLRPAPLCSDSVFVRRVFLDVTGTLPTADEAKAFIEDPSPDKRCALIDRLLERPEFAHYWAMKWGDVLRVKSEFPINLWPNGAQAYHRWIYESIRDNKRYDQFARELLTASGSNFRVPPVNFFRAVQEKSPAGIAQAAALTFLGARTDKWPAEKLSGLSAYFWQVKYKPTGEWKEEIIYFDPSGASTRPAAVLPDGSSPAIRPGQDPREVFAGWLTSPSNPWFAKVAANRVWAWLLGRGIIHEVDDFRPDNAPSHSDLLALLEREFVASKYDLKRLYRLILNSSTYQLSSLAAGDAQQSEHAFACYRLRRLEAEVLMDALCQVTGTSEKYSSAIPEPFTFIPESYRTIMLPDGSITSAALDMFGRPPRDTGLDSERNNRPSPDQRLYLLNASHVQRKLEQGRGFQPLLQSKTAPRDAIRRIYLTLLSRFPTDAELRTAEGHVKASAKQRDGLVDVAWALINSAEFLYRH
jgi:hypothetical protein